MAIRQSRAFTPERVAQPPAAGGFGVADLVRQQGESVAAIGTVALCVFSAAVGAVIGRASAWAWGLAGAVHVAVAITQRRTARRLGLATPVRTPEEAHRRRRTLWITASAFGLMGAGQVTALVGERRGGDLLVAVGSTCVLAAVVMLVVAGWSSIWVASTAPERSAAARSPADRRPGVPSAAGDGGHRVRAAPELPSPFTTRRSRGGTTRQDVDPPD